MKYVINNAEGPKQRQKEQTQ